MDIAKAKLVTIVMALEYAEGLQRDLSTLGVRGYTSTTVNGRGEHGKRTYGMVDGANTRFEIITNAEHAKQIFEHISPKFEGLPFLAYVQDIEAIPAAQFR